jgi:hypothetical protein
MRLFALSPMTDRAPLSAGEIAAFIDGSLKGAALDRFRARVADDPQARRELIESARLVGSVPSIDVRKPSRTRWLVPLAAAAAIGVVLLNPTKTKEALRPVAVERSAPKAVRATGVDLLYPAESGSMSAGESFVWRSSAGATYRIMISDAAGRSAFNASTTDTVFPFPHSLKPGAYYWTVDVLSPDGSSATSGARELIIRSP